jgi:high-affinity iron transporter
VTRRLFFAVIAFATLALAAPAAWASHTTSGGDVTAEEGVHELETARDLVDESVELYEAGNVEDAYIAARNSYLDHFEYVEIPLRVRDEGLTLAVEEDYAALRNLIEAEAPLGEIESVAAEVHRGLDDVERTLSEPGLAAPVLALVYAFTIIFREGLEAVLVVAAVLGYLEASRNTQYRGAVLKGVGAAVVATVVLFVATTLFVQLAPLQRELLEAGTALLAVGVLFYVSFWLISRLEHRRWMEFMKAKVWAAATTGSTLALAGVGFTAVFREGFETTLFFQALISFAQGLIPYVVIGSVAGVAVLAVIGWIIFKAGRKIPVRSFLTTAVLLVMVLSVAFVGNAVRGFQEATYLPITHIESLPDLPIFVAQLTGWYPTRETILAQGALTLVYVLGAVWTFVVLPRRERAVSRPSDTEDVATDSVQEQASV